MSLFVEKYTSEQRAAMAEAVLDRGIKPARRVVQLAAAGELHHDGKPLDAFETTENTVRDLARNLKKRRAGTLKSDLASLPPRDAVEALRRRFVSLCDHEMAVEEEKKRGTVDMERMRQIARAMRELAAIPGPNDPRPPRPGDKVPGTRTTQGGKTAGGLAGQLLHAAGQGAASKRPDTPAPRPAAEPPNTQETDGRDSTRSEQQTNEHNTHAEGSPGAWAREQASALLGVGGATEQGHGE